MDKVEKDSKEEVGKKAEWKINIKYWLAVELATLVIIVILVWGLFSLPAVFYFVRPADAKIQGTCTAQLYTNNASLCYPFLTQYKSCIPSLTNKSGVYIASSVNLQESESTASQIQSLQASLSPQCRAVALPFLCLYLFPLCDDNQTAYFPSMAECITISTALCTTEWKIASQFVNLPVCSVLPNVTSCSGSTTSASTTPTSTTPALTTPTSPSNGNEETCTAQLYANYTSLCYPFLNQQQSCIPSLTNKSGVYIASSVNLEESESTASQIQSLQASLSPHCQEVILPILCLYLFPLCDDNRTAYFPSMAECITISTVNCTEMLSASLANNFFFCSTLPNVSSCNSSVTPATAIVPTTMIAQTTMITPTPTSISLSAVNKTCSENFIFNGNYCLPDCPKWSLRASGANADYVVVFAAVVGLISGTIVLLLSCIRHRRMFAFPSILVVYQTIITVLLALFAVISFIDPKGLYCITPDWIGSLTHTTPFCSISGSILFFCLMELAVLWICHVAVIFWNVIFPLQVMDFNSQHRMKYIHASIVCVALLIPAITVAVVFGTGGFITGTFPPVLCVSKSPEAAFYALVLPISIIIPSGVTLLLVVFWNVHKQHIIQREQRSKSPIRLGTAEKKVLIVFIYYVLLGIIALAAFGVNVRTGNAFKKAVSEYFFCENTTPGNCEESKNKALENTFPGLTNTSYILLALFPLVNLVYAFNFNELRDILRARRKVKLNSSRPDTTESALEKSHTTSF